MQRTRAFQVPESCFALRGTNEDFLAAERVLGPIPRRKRCPVINGEELHFYRESSADNDLWPTTGQLRQYNIRVYASGQFITWKEEEE